MLLAPQKHIRAHARGLAQNLFRKPTPVGFRFLGAGLLQRRAPRGLCHFPVPVGAPLRDHVGLVPTVLRQHAGEAVDVRVGVYRVKVNVRAARFDQIHFVAVQSGRHRGGGVVGVQFVDHFGNVLHGVPNVGIGVEQIHFVPDAPTQERGVVLQPQNGLPEVLFLRSHAVCVAVVKSVALVLQPQAHHDGEPVLLRLVQNPLGIFQAPRAQRIAAQGHNLVHVDGPTGTVHVVGLPTAHQLPSAVGCLLHTCWDRLSLQQSSTQRTRSEQKGSFCVKYTRIYPQNKSAQTGMNRTFLHGAGKNLGASYGNFNNFLLVSS